MWVGIDLGGTKLAAVALDERGTELARLRLPTPRDYPATLEVLCGTVSTLERQAGPAAAVGLGLPGLIDDAAGTVRAVNLPWLEGQSLAHDLRQRLGRPVALANDADCFALSETRDGAAAGCRLVVGLVLGTGVGGALLVNGRLVRGAHGLTGELGHLPLPWREPQDGPPVPCGCGREGCIETLLSGAGLERLFAAAGGAPALSAAEIASRGDSGDTIAARALALYFSALARTLAFVINFTDPEAIVLGGGVSGIPGLCEAVPQLWGRHTLVGNPRTRLVRARHGADSGVRGAAWLGRQATLPE